MRSSAPTRIVSFVGFQPSATAVAIKSWAVKSGPGPIRVALLATSAVFKEQVPQRLSRCLRRLLTDLSGDVFVVSDGLEDTPGAPAPTRAVREWLAANPRGGPLVYCADSGLTTQIVTVARALPPSALYLHNDTSGIHVLNSAGERTLLPASDIGFDNLLELYDLQTAPAAEPPPHLLAWLTAHPNAVPGNVHTGVRLAGRGGPTLHFAYERTGFLYGVCTAEDFESVRAVQRLPNELNGLRPVLAVLADNSMARRRARASGLQSLSPSVQLERWLRGADADPGHTTSVPLPRSVLLSPVRGAGGEGPPLIVWMGTDPSATLVSLCSHQPHSAEILYDAATPRAVEMTQRLYRHGSKLPVGQLSFTASDAFGSGIAAAAVTSIASTTRADITPGRKSQALALARLRSLQLWSLRSNTGEAVSLDGKKAIPLRAPALLIQAQVCGGPLIHQGNDAARWNERRQRFFGLLSGVLANVISEHGSTRLDPLPRLLSARGSRLSTDGDRVAVELDGEQSWLNMAPNGGEWFERLVALAFVAAGADEVRQGIRWQWEGRKPRPGEPLYHRDEIDVVVRFGHRFLAISCKLGAAVNNRSNKQEIEAVTAACLGRLAIPLLAGPCVKPALVTAGAQAKRGAAYLDLATLSQPKHLHAAVEQMFHARSTRDDI